VFPAVVLARRFGVPVVYDMQSSLPEQLTRYAMFRSRPVQALLRRFERWALQNVHTVMTSAGLVARVRAVAPGAQAGEWAYYSEPTLVSDAEVLALRNELAIEADSRVILYTGTFEEYQGLELLLRAIPRIVSRVRPVTVVLVGAGGAGKQSVLRQAADLQLNGCVRLVDRQPRDRMALYLHMADVLVSPRAFGGNLPLKIFDYLASGRPIVATDIPTHRSVLDDQRAILVAPDPDAIADAVLSLLEDPHRALALGSAGRKYAEEHLARRSFVRTVREVLAALGRPARTEPLRMADAPR
jgi:glycosyltransferase involved in cell wall biosynthesis